LNFTSDPERADERAQARRDALAFTISGPIVTVLLLVVWAVTGRGYFWPMWPLLGWGLGLLGPCSRGATRRYPTARS
jgi:hypothetical protein